MVDFIHSFHDLVDRGHQEVGKVNLELEESVVSLPVEKMLEQFVLQKYTGLVCFLPFTQTECSRVSSSRCDQDLLSLRLKTSLSPP